METYKNSAAVDFLIRLRKIDRAGLTHRDVIVLYTIMANPGVNGQETSKLMGIPQRSQIQMGLDRLIRKGLIEDRRAERSKTCINRLYVTPAGEEFWNDLKP